MWPRLMVKDYEMMPSGKSVIWKHQVYWQRTRMKIQGYLKGSPGGFWEITKEGRNHYEIERRKHG